MLNPYELLGVTIDSPKDDIKKIYYQLSLLAHPDKGGNNDDMITLKKAYDFVIKEINNINNTVTIEDLEQNFKDFCSTQENKVPMFQDIYAEAFDLFKFNDYFEATEKTELIGGSILGGYGNIMEKSSLSLEYKDIESGSSLKHQFVELTEYKAPQETQVCQNLLDLTIKGPINNYTLDTGGLHMSDYKQAFTVTNNQLLQELPKPIIVSEESPNIKTLEELIKEREEEDVNFDKQASTQKEYTWSYEGIVDSARNIIKDFFKIK
jgi:hypothetical protein